MATPIEMLHMIASPDWIMQNGGLYIVLFIIFAETGLFFGFFLPGDSLLFIAGMILANTLHQGGTSFFDLIYWIVLISIAGILGNYVGYYFGKKSGEVLLKSKDSWIFKKKHLIQASNFYQRKGGSTIIFARFLPIARTFAPIVAGMVKMNTKTFTIYNIAGSVIWVGSIMTAGYLLGEYDWVKGNLEKIIIGIVLITTAPLIFKAIFGDRKEMVSTPTIQSSHTADIKE